jgi:hypothetical protein
MLAVDVSMPHHVRSVAMVPLCRPAHCGWTFCPAKSLNKEATMAKNQNTFEKRRREMEKKMKAEEKRKRRDKKKDEASRPAEPGPPQIMEREFED